MQINDLQKLPAKWLRLEPWKKWCRSILVKIVEGSLLSSLPAEVDNGESPAFEVLKFREKEGYFGMSSEIRTVKPPGVTFRVGQVDCFYFYTVLVISHHFFFNQTSGSSAQTQKISGCHRRLG